MSTDAVRVLEDRDRIHDVMMRYAHGVDQRDMDVVRACFAPDLVTVGWGPPGESFDRDALIRFISGVGHFRETMHMMGNQLVEVDGDRAAMDTFATLTHRLDGDDEKLLVSSHYVEQLARRDGEWLIVRRGGDATWVPTGVTGLTSDDPAVRWLLDRAELRDALVRTTVEAERRADGPVRNFLGSRLVDVTGDTAVAESYALVTPFTAEGGRARPDPVITPQRWFDRWERVDGRWRLVAHTVDGPDRITARPAVPETDDPRVRALVDRAALLDAVVGASRAVDDRDEGLLRSWLEPACTIDGVGTGPIAGADAVVEHLRATTWRTAAQWRFLNNHLVELDGDDAHVQSYAFVVEQRTGAPSPSSWTDGARRFLDTLHRGDDGRWRLAARDIVDNVMPDEKVIADEGGDRTIAGLTRRAQDMARRSD